MIDDREERARRYRQPTFRERFDEWWWYIWQWRFWLWRSKHNLMRCEECHHWLFWGDHSGHVPY